MASPRVLRKRMSTVFTSCNTVRYNRSWGLFSPLFRLCCEWVLKDLEWWCFSSKNREQMFCILNHEWLLLQFLCKNNQWLSAAAVLLALFLHAQQYTLIFSQNMDNRLDCLHLKKTILFAFHLPSYAELTFQSTSHLSDFIFIQIPFKWLMLSTELKWVSSVCLCPMNRVLSL